MFTIILNFLEKLTTKKDVDKKFFWKLIYVLFIPIIYLLELSVYLYYWKHIIVKEILTNDTLVDFFDRNEFGYEKNKFIKAELLESNEFFDRINFDEAKQVIKSEFANNLYTLFKENIVFNIEEYINILVNVEMKVIKNNGELFRSKIYMVTLQFYRNYYLNKTKKALMPWFILVSIIVSVSYLIFNQYLSTLLG